MDTARLAAIRAREQAASPGPWFTKAKRSDYGADYVTHVVNQEAESKWHTVAEQLAGEYGIGMICEMIGDSTDADHVFIAAARADVPDLLAEVERLRAVRPQIEAEIARMSTETHRSVLRWVLRLLKGEQE